MAAPRKPVAGTVVKHAGHVDCVGSAGSAGSKGAATPGKIEVPLAADIGGCVSIAFNGPNVTMRVTPEPGFGFTVTGLLCGRTLLAMDHFIVHPETSTPADASGMSKALVTFFMDIVLPWLMMRIGMQYTNTLYETYAVQKRADTANVSLAFCTKPAAAAGSAGSADPRRSMIVSIVRAGVSTVEAAVAVRPVEVYNAFGFLALELDLQGHVGDDVHLLIEMVEDALIGYPVHWIELCCEQAINTAGVDPEAILCAITVCGLACDAQIAALRAAHGAFYVSAAHPVVVFGAAVRLIAPDDVSAVGSAAEAALMEIEERAQFAKREDERREARKREAEAWRVARERDRDEWCRERDRLWQSYRDAAWHATHETNWREQLDSAWK